MPAVVNSTVGSFSGMTDALGMTACPFSRKNSKNFSRSSFALIMCPLCLHCIFAGGDIPAPRDCDRSEYGSAFSLTQKSPSCQQKAPFARALCKGSLQGKPRRFVRPSRPRRKSPFGGPLPANTHDAQLEKSASNAIINVRCVKKCAKAVCKQENSETGKGSWEHENLRVL